MLQEGQGTTWAELAESRGHSQETLQEHLQATSRWGRYGPGGVEDAHAADIATATNKTCVTHQHEVGHTLAHGITLFVVAVSPLQLAQEVCGSSGELDVDATQQHCTGHMAVI